MKIGQAQESESRAVIVVDGEVSGVSRARLMGDFRYDGISPKDEDNAPPHHRVSGSSIADGDELEGRGINCRGQRVLAVIG